MTDIDEKYLKTEFEFKKCFENNNSSNFIDKFKNYLLLNTKNKCTELRKDYGSYLYFPNKIDIVPQKNALIVIHELSRTGAPVVAFDTAKVLQKNGYFVTLVSVAGGPLLQEIIDCGIPVIILNHFKYMQFEKSGIENFTNKLDLDVFIKAFDKIIMITATLYNLIKRYENINKNIFWWIHEGSATYSIIGSKMPKKLASNIKVWCGGNYSSYQLNKNGFEYNQTVLNYGVYDHGFGNYDTKHKKIKFLIAGSLGIRKGQLMFLNSILNMPNELMNKSEFIFVGDAHENDMDGIKIKDQLNDACKKYSNIKFYSSMEREKLFDLYKKIDVLVLASIDDPMPVVATENLMLGNVVLCSTNTGTSYYLENMKNGFVFKSGNVNDLKNKLIYIIKNKNQLKDIGQRGRKVFEKYFEMDIFENNFFNLIEVK